LDEQIKQRTLEEVSLSKLEASQESASEFLLLPEQIHGCLTQWIYHKTADNFQMTLKGLIRFQTPAFPHPLYLAAHNERHTPKATIFCQWQTGFNCCSHSEGQ